MLRTACTALAVAAFFSFDAPPSQAQGSGNAQWCAVINEGFGDVVWDCHYNSAAECAPNVVAGNRGFCNVNPTWKAPAAGAPHTKRHRHS
jgi:hypothetical protein